VFNAHICTGPDKHVSKLACTIQYIVILICTHAVGGGQQFALGITHLRHWSQRINLVAGKFQ